MRSKSTEEDTSQLDKSEDECRDSSTQDSNDDSVCVCACTCVCVLSHVRLFATPRTVACQSPLSMKFSRKEYWSGLPFPSPGDLPDPGIGPGYPALQADSLPFFLSHQRSLFQAYIFKSRKM